MANWTNSKDSASQKEEQQTQKEELAYINKETREAAKENPIIDTLSKAVLEAAKDVMNNLEEAGKTTQSTTRDGKTTYTDKAVVKVEPATKWNKETKESEPLVHKDGSQVYKATAEIKHNGTTLTLTAKEDVSDGAKFVAMNAQKWDRPKDGSPKLNFYKQDEIANAYINKDIKAIAAHIQEQGFITEKSDRSALIQNSLQQFAVEANQYFNANTEKVPNENGELVNNAYAKYSKDNYGERVTLYNHTDNTAVELGETSGGDKYAVAINYDLNREFEPRQQGETPAKAFINNKKDLENFIDLPEIREAVAEYKNISNKEQTKETPKKEKANIERD